MAVRHCRGSNPSHAAGRAPPHGPPRQSRRGTGHRRPRTTGAGPWPSGRSDRTGTRQPSPLAPRGWTRNDPLRRLRTRHARRYANLRPAGEGALDPDLGEKRKQERRANDQQVHGIEKHWLTLLCSCGPAWSTLRNTDPSASFDQTRLGVVHLSRYQTQGGGTTPSRTGCLRREIVAI